MNLSNGHPYTKSFYEENGYIIVNNTISKSECDDIKNTLEQHTTDDYTNMLNPDRYEFLVSQTTHRIHMYAITDFTECLTCNSYNTTNNIGEVHGTYVGLSNVRFQTGCTANCVCP